MSFFSSAGPGDGAEADAELLAHDLRQRRLPEPGRAGEQHVVERLAAPLGGVERDAELLLDPLLADEVVEPARPQGALDLLVLGVQHGGRRRCRSRDRLGTARMATREPGRQAAASPPAHAARSASRTRSAGGSSGSTSASRCSASSTE